MKKVLLPIDGSKRSIRTVEMVKQFCDPAECEIVIAKVIGAQLYLNSSTGPRKPSLSWTLWRRCSPGFR